MTQENIQSEKYLFTLTTFGDVDRISAPLVLANSALSTGKQALLWLTLEGVELAIKGATENLATKSFAPVKELLDSFIENGGRIGVCPPCAKTHGVTDDNMLPTAELMGAVALLDEAAGSQSFTF
jgi:uncharacterized protein